MGRGVDAILKCSERTEGLNGGRGHILAANAAVDHGSPAVIAVELRPVIARDATDKYGRIERGGARHAQDLAVGAIHADARAGVRLITRGLALFHCALEALFARLLDFKVDRKLDIATGSRRNGPRLGGDVTRGIDLYSLLATDSLQQAFVARLDTRLANDVAGLVLDIVRRGLAVLLALILSSELVAGNGTGVAKHVARKRSIRVNALGALVDMDIGELGRMLLDVGDRRQANVRCNGMQALRALRVV